MKKKKFGRFLVGLLICVCCASVITTQAFTIADRIEDAVNGTQIETEAETNTETPFI